MDQVERLILLRSLPFFGGLPEARLAPAGCRGAGGDPCPGRDHRGQGPVGRRAFHLVASGRAKLYQIGPDGKEQTLVYPGAG